MATATVVSAEEGEQDRESLTLPLLSSQISNINSTSQVAIVGANVCPIESLDYEYICSSSCSACWVLLFLMD